jgi:peptide deformylase
MPLSDIITLPHKNLRKKSLRVTNFEDLTNLIAKMEDATLDWEESREHEVGVALAAVQINSLKKVVIIRNNFDNKDDKSFQIFINPEITKYEGNVVEDYEGCLSITDIYGLVPRYSKVRVKATNIDGKEIRVKAEGFLARVFQHEIDHTNGIVFIDHIKDSKEAFYKLNPDGKLTPLDFNEHIKGNKELWS